MSAPFWDLSRLDATRFDAALFDHEGFLREPSRWSPDLADEIARCLDLNGAAGLTPAHREVLAACRDFHARYQRMPTTRVFVKYLGEQLGPGFAGSAALMRLFPDTPMRLVALCAGLPKPPNCF